MSPRPIDTRLFCIASVTLQPSGDRCTLIVMADYTRRVIVNPDDPGMLWDGSLGWVCLWCRVVARSRWEPPPACGDPCADFIKSVESKMDKAALEDLRAQWNAEREAERAKEKAWAEQRAEAERARLEAWAEERAKEWRRNLQARYDAAEAERWQPHPYAIRRLKEDGRLP
jgi:hypothetical protein